MVVPGTYRTSPVVSAAERAAGLAFDAAHTTVATAPVTDVAFTQTRLSARGRVHCLEGPCGVQVSVSLTAVGEAAAAAVTATLGGANGDTFAFERLMPGTYTLQVGPPRGWVRERSVGGKHNKGAEISLRSPLPGRLHVWKKPKPRHLNRIAPGGVGLFFFSTGASCAQPVVLVAARASGAGRGGRRVRGDARADGLSDARAHVARHAGSGDPAGTTNPIGCASQQPLTPTHAILPAPTNSRLTAH